MGLGKDGVAWRRFLSRLNTRAGSILTGKHCPKGAAHAAASLKEVSGLGGSMSEH